MKIMVNKITLLKISPPSKPDLNTRLQFFSQSLGLFGSRDKEKSCFRIFIALIEAKKASRMLSSDEIAEKANLTRATAIHHLKNLEEHGLIKQEQKRYALRCNSFSALIQQLEKESQGLFENLEEVAEELDKKLELR